MLDPIEVSFKAASTSWGIKKELERLGEIKTLGFDVETRSLYSTKERKTAEELLKRTDLNLEEKKKYMLISNTSGLSHPSLVQTTHFIFGESESFSTVLVAETPYVEQAIWDWLVQTDSLFLIHNSLFDLRICHHRTGRIVNNFTDTALVTKTLVNDANNAKSRTGLKHLMGSYYPPAWSLFEDYDNPNLKDPKALLYAATDGCAVYKLWELLQEETK